MGFKDCQEPGRGQSEDKADFAPTVFVCRECPGGEQRLAQVRAVLDERDSAVVASACLGGCRSGASVAVRAAGGMAYLFGPLGQAEIACLPEFLRLYHKAPGGVIADARPLGALRFCLLARIPAIPLRPPA